MKLRPLFLGNWKMFMREQEVAEFAKSFLANFTPIQHAPLDTGFAAPFTSLSALRQNFPAGCGVLRGAQNVHWLDDGAHTGEISAPMLVEHAIDFVVVGHSERRQYYGETSENVARRALAAIRHGMTAVICIGESRTDFEAGNTQNIIRKQLPESLEEFEQEHLSQLVIAYEPIWAIGTGLAATPEIVKDAHDFIREQLISQFGQKGAEVRIIYGGSVKPDYISEVIALENVNGALVGAASLNPDTFNRLIELGRQALANA